MELAVRDGDYVPDGRGGFLRAEGDDALIQRVLWKLGVRRGSFPFLPRLGSRLYLLPRAGGSQRSALAKTYVAEALQDEEDLSVEDVTLTQRPEGTALLQVELRQGGRTLHAELEV